MGKTKRRGINRDIGVTRRSMEVLLAEDVATLGNRGDIVKVKPGYARNYLLPQGYAAIATEENKRAVVRHKQRHAVSSRRGASRRWQHHEAGQQQTEGRGASDEQCIFHNDIS